MKNNEKNVLFLCTGNSCRSQMAEGWGKALKRDGFNFYSAGTVKSKLNSRAVLVMQEAGVDISNHQSKSIDEIQEVKMDFVFTVCSDAHENCPLYEGGKTIHVGFDDPPRLTKEMTDESEVLKEYRRVRDEIKNMILNLEKYTQSN